MGLEEKLPDGVLLASVEKLFHLPLLGYARTVTSTFGKDVFTRR